MCCSSVFLDPCDYVGYIINPKLESVPWAALPLLSPTFIHLLFIFLGWAFSFIHRFGFGTATKLTNHASYFYKQRCHWFLLFELNRHNKQDKSHVQKTIPNQLATRDHLFWNELRKAWNRYAVFLQKILKLQLFRQLRLFVGQSDGVSRLRLEIDSLIIYVFIHLRLCVEIDRD